MKYAIIQIGSHQYKVSVGDQIQIEKTSDEPDSLVVFDQVLLIAEGDKVQVGTPTLPLTVSAKVLGHLKAKKIRVATYKAKSRFRKTKGHRHQYTKIEIMSIGAKLAKPQTKTQTAPAKKAPAKKSAVKKLTAK